MVAVGLGGLIYRGTLALAATLIAASISPRTKKEALTMLQFPGVAKRRGITVPTGTAPTASTAQVDTEAPSVASEVEAPRPRRRSVAREAKIAAGVIAFLTAAGAFMAGLPQVITAIKSCFELAGTRTWCRCGVEAGTSGRGGGVRPVGLTNRGLGRSRRTLRIRWRPVAGKWRRHVRRCDSPVKPDLLTPGCCGLRCTHGRGATLEKPTVSGRRATCCAAVVSV